MENIPKRTTQRKILFVAVVFAVVFSCGLIGRLYKLQIIDGDKYQKLAIEQQMKSKEIAPQRGTIYDRNMKPLAQSASAWTVVADPSKITGDAGEKEAEKRLVSKGLSEILEIDEQKIYDICSVEGSSWGMLKKRIDKETADKVTKFTSDNKIRCISLEYDTKRVYPYG
ncbi:MAG: stage V sporulation protein D, partial [Oscillospiraceae bacterium]